MKTQSVEVKAIAKELGRTADGRIQWHLTATLEPGLPNGFFRGRDLDHHQRLTATDHSDLGRGQRSGRRLGDPFDHQLRSTQARPIREKSSACGRPLHLRSQSLSGSQPSLTAVEEKPGSSADHTVNITLKAPTDLSGPFHAILEVESDLKDEPPAKIKTFATIVGSQ